MPRRFKQPIWIIPLLIAGLVALFGWWADVRLRETIRAQLRDRLSTTLNANVAALEIWATNQLRVATSLAEDRELKALAIRVFERSAEPPAERNRGGNIALLDEVATSLAPKLRFLDYDIAQLVNTNLIIAAGSPRRPGVGMPVLDAHTNKFLELFATGEPILITPFRPEFRPPRRPPPPPREGGRTNEFPRRSGFSGRTPFRQWSTNEFFQRRRGDVTMMQVAAPIHQGDAVIGALALVINPTNEFTRILSVARTGESGETYAFDQTGLLISRSRFEDQLARIGLLGATNSGSALNLRLHDPGGNLVQGFKPASTNVVAQPLIHIVATALEGEEDVDLEPSRDYRGVAVVGASRWLPRLGFGVATQIDADEAYRPLRVLRTIFTSLFLLLVLCAVALFVFSYANVTWRRRLTEAELKLKQLGQYTLEEKIGEGGMGVVYRARHALMRRDTAVKLLMPDRADEAAIERFEREVVLTCQLAHPNTIQVYDYGHTPEGIFYYAMEFLQGLNLHQLVARFGPQPEGRVIHILTQICDSLAEAHALGLVHRDIKPANVFLCDRGGVPDCVKVLDFGLVREYGRGGGKLQITGEGNFVGTPVFMSPEAIKDSSKSDPRSDIYSLGALAYYLLSGKYVFEGDSVLAIYERQLTGAIVPLSKSTTNAVSPQLDEIILRCLDKDAAHRPQSALELRELLRTSPLAFAWTPAERARWWATHRNEVFAAAETGSGGASPVPTLKIDFESRMQ